jgi:hypothetical protein
MTRRIVVLPDPDGPMITTRSPGSTSRSSSRSTTLSPKALSTPRIRTPAAPLGETSMSVGRWSQVRSYAMRFLQSSDQPGRREADQQEADTDEQVGLDRAEVVARMVLAKNSTPGTPTDRTDRGVLERGDEVVAERRQDVGHGLRDDDPVHLVTGLRFSAVAASHWPLGTLLMPAR